MRRYHHVTMIINDCTHRGYTSRMRINIMQQVVYGCPVIKREILLCVLQTVHKINTKRQVMTVGRSVHVLYFRDYLVLVIYA